MQFVVENIIQFPRNPFSGYQRTNGNDDGDIEQEQISEPMDV
jgi:hypothetical protein